MEIRFRVLLLIAAASLGGCASIRHLIGHSAPAPSAQDEAPDADRSVGSDQPPDAGEAPGADSSQNADESAPRVIVPQVERRRIKVPHIRSTNIEVGGYYGTLNIEDFGAHPVYGVQAAYHITEDIFVQAEAGRSKGGFTSFEKLSNVQLLTEGERWFKYYDLSLGYNLFPGEVFLGRNLAMRSTFYLLGGIGGTDFGGDQKFTVNFGAGYKVLPADWIAVHVAVEDRVFNTDLLGVSK
ncbi:MAG: outer membrane beta-barrel domain-containing protein, partial [Steroidobacteraceae bacterium]